MNSKVLVADDSKVIRTIIGDMVRDFGVKEVVEAVDGNEAVTAFQQDEFDLVILDWQMPGMCGLEVIETIRASGSKVPIIMITGTGVEHEHVVDAVEAGASDYLLKPFKPGVLRKKQCLNPVPGKVPSRNRPL